MSIDPRPPVILVNGLPAAGKTTLSRRLAPLLGATLIGKDTIKETIADHLGADSPDGRTQRQWSMALGAATGETMWELLRYAYGEVMLESSLRPEHRELAKAGLARVGVTRMVEVYCTLPAELAHQRYTDRLPNRHAVHGGFTPGELADWQAASRAPLDLGLGPVIEVDTSAPLSDATVAELADRCRTALKDLRNPAYRSV